MRSTASAARAVEAVLTQESPEPDAGELRLAMRLALGVRASDLGDPMPLIRALHRLSSHPEVGERASTTLRRTCWDLLFPQLLRDDEAGRQEARAVLDAVATPDDRSWFADFVRSQPIRLRLRHRLRRR